MSWSHCGPGGSVSCITSGRMRRAEQMTVFARPGSAGALMSFESRYDNFIGGEWVAPAACRYFENLTPVTGQPFCEVARSDAADVEKALDAAHGAAKAWGKTAPA